MNRGAWLFLGVLISACGATDGGSPNTGEPATLVTPDSACAAYAEASCARYAACSTFAVPQSFGDAATCQARLKLQCTLQMAVPSTGMTAATVSACARALPSATCGALAGRTVPECTFKGTIINGAKCSQREQCQSGSCRIASGTCGVCAAVLAAGQACTYSYECARGFTCSSSVCRAWGTAGQACSDTQPCSPELYCHAGTCALPISTPGAACTPTEWGSCNELNGLTCKDASAVCAQLRLASPGQACGTVAGDEVLCSGGGDCQVASGATRGICLAPAADGAACDTTRGVRCLAPATCTNKICVLPSSPTCP